MDATKSVALAFLVVIELLAACSVAVVTVVRDYQTKAHRPHQIANMCK
jgi:hypothetical protein